jgi:hypothetical protein
MSLQLNRLRTADRLVAGAAIALLASMFLFDWYGESHTGTLPGSNLSGLNYGSTGWETFTYSRWIWLLTIVVALASVVATASAVRLAAWLEPGAIVLLLGAVSAVTILYRIIHHPAASVGFGGFHASNGIKFGIWLGLIAALAIAGGGYLQLRPGRARSFSTLLLSSTSEMIRAIIALAARGGARGKADPAGDPSDRPAPSQEAFTGLTVSGASPPAAPSAAPPAAPQREDKPPPVAGDGG